MELSKDIDFSDFLKVDIRAGLILRAETFPKAKKPSIKLWIDFGPLGERKSSAQITKLYNVNDLPGRMILAVCNFPPRQIADFMSEVLVLGVMEDEETVVLLQPERNVTPGQRVF